MLKLHAKAEANAKKCKPMAWLPSVAQNRLKYSLSQLSRKAAKKLYTAIDPPLQPSVSSGVTQKPICNPESQHHVHGSPLFESSVLSHDAWSPILGSAQKPGWGAGPGGVGAGGVGGVGDGGVGGGVGAGGVGVGAGGDGVGGTPPMVTLSAVVTAVFKPQAPVPRMIL